MDIRRITVCHDCLAALRATKATRLAAPVARQWLATNAFSTLSPPPPYHAQQQTRQIVQLRRLATQQHPSLPSSLQPSDLNDIHTRIQALSKSVLRPDDGAKVPAEERVLYVLEQLHYLAKLVLDERIIGTENAQSKPQQARGKQQHQQRKETATSALLGSVNARSFPTYLSTTSILNSVSEKAEEIVRSPNVFITPAILKTYVQLQSDLHHPTSFPDLFDMYARKPIPTQKGGEVILSPASPDQMKSAVPSDAATVALQAAIEAHNLPLAIDIISTSYCTPAFKKAKTFRQAAFPIAGLGVAPLAAYSLSQAFSNMQQSMDPGMATGIAFAGIMTYVGAVGMVGYVAVTTANDQMDRVTWAGGVPLWERWVREEERAAIDMVAGAWGFKDRSKRGEEEGEEWEALREWVGSRGMVLDKVSLMEGME